MKKRNLIYILGIILCFMQSGCLDDSYTGTVYVGEYVDGSVPHEVIMTLGKTESDTKSSTATKGSGVIGEISNFEGKDFYIYAFNKEVESEFSVLASEDNIRCLIDGTLDDPNTLMGRKAHWDSWTSSIQWGVGDSPIYYPMGEHKGHDYDFFAYYLDNIEPQNSDIKRGKTDVKINIEIDGCQDIMSAKAKPTDMQLAAIEDERERLYQQAHCYSYYTASHNLNPNFDFKHHLVKLDFKLVPGGTPGMTKDVTVEKIEVVSKYKGTFTVADKNDTGKMGVRFKDDKKRLELKEIDGSEFRPRVISTFNGTGSVNDIDDLGSLIVAPDDEYYLYIVLSEEYGDIVLDSTETELYIYQGQKDGDRIEFTAGNEYLITLTIYGQMDVRVSADIGEWNSGGGFDYDHDEAFRPGKN